MNKKDIQGMIFPRFAISKPVTVYVIFLAVIIIGLISLSKLSIDLMPAKDEKQLEQQLINNFAARGRQQINTLLKDLDLQDLIVYIDKSSVDGEFQSDKFEELIRALEESDAVVPGLKEDRDVQDIVTQMQKAREALDNPEAMEQNFTELTEHMKQTNQEKKLEPGEEEL